MMKKFFPLLCLFLLPLLAQAGGGSQPASEVKIEGNKVLISNSRVRTPVEVRYGWDEAAVTNLCNPQGLPARQARVRLPFEKKSLY